MELGTTARQIHQHGLASDVLQLLPRENFIPTRRGILTRLQVSVAANDVRGSVREELVSFWKSHRKIIGQLIDRCDELGRFLRSASPKLILCHADLHTWNVLVGSGREMWIVDWDETILAMRERDLMFVVGGIGAGLVRPDEAACFLRGYGDTQIDPLALAYYRYAWALQDMAAYGEQVLFMPELSDASRRDALHGFMLLFEPGEIVDIAFASEGVGGQTA